MHFCVRYRLVVLMRILLGSEGAPMPDELFCFSQLLETHKPFLVNLFRVPTVQSAFITSRSSASGHRVPSFFD